MARKKQIDEDDHKNKVEKAKAKELKSQKYAEWLATQDRREMMRDSAESKAINEKLYGTKYWFLPEYYRKALLEEFHDTYDQNKENLENAISKTPSSPAIMHKTPSLKQNHPSTVKAQHTLQFSKGGSKEKNNKTPTATSTNQVVKKKESSLKVDNTLEYMEDLGFP